MSNTTAAVFFLISWWLIFFITLPFGVHRLRNPEPGMDQGAPERPRILIKAAVTTLAAGAITLALRWAMDNDLISLRDVLSS